MNRFLLTAAVAALSLSAAAAPAGVWRPGAQQKDAFRFAPKAKAEQTHTAGAEAGLARVKAMTAAKGKSAAVESHSLPEASNTGYLDTPAGETWFYTIENKSTVIDHGSYKSEEISGYTITVYDAAFNEVGKIDDDIEFEQEWTGVAMIQVGSLLTKKFFNTDNNYELMVLVSFNTAQYVNVDRTFVYGLNPTQTATAPLRTMEGYYVDAINTAKDRWSENYWMTFYTEAESETPEIGGVINPGDMVLSTYKYSGYSGMGDPVLVNRVPLITSTGENYVPMISCVHEGLPYFVVNRLKYCWFLDPFNYEDDTPTPGNKLLIDIYSPASSWSSTLDKYCTTEIPLNTTLEDMFFLSIGNFSYSGDINIGRYTDDGTPALIITKENKIGADAYDYNYDVYKAAAKGTEGEGEHLLNLARKVSGGIFLNDVKGFDPQVMFIRPSGSNTYMDFTNLVTGEVEHSLPVSSTGLSLNANTERIPFGDSYLYVAAQNRGESQPNGDVYTYVAYFNPDGTLHHTDKLNLGKLVDMASVYTAPDAFNPYIFNLDDKLEYMVLVKRREAAGAVGNHEELMVISNDPADAPVFVYAPTEELGAVVSVFFANLESSTPRMVILTQKGSKYITTAYTLPMQLFAEGDGSEANPYIIDTAGGLLQLCAFPGAHYALGCDIDAAGHPLAIRDFEFSGSLDGRGHSIINLELDGNSLIYSMTRPESAASDSKAATVCDINFIDPVFNAGKDERGLLLGQMRGGVVRNVHIYGGKMTSQADVAGLVAGAYLNSLVENCSVNADIAGSENSSVGGVVLDTRTGSIIRACAFSGTLEGGEGIGGIVADMSHKDDVIENCHVNATITGKNTIGGIAGESAHGTIRFCHVEGSITATEAPRWGGGPKTGGIVGALAPMAQGESGEGESQPNIAVEGCYVNLNAFDYTGEASTGDSWPGQSDTMHRIVGSSAGNGEPEVVDYDDWYEPIYGEPAAPEAGLKNNYAVNTLDKVSESIEDATGTTEGMSVDPYETGVGFFSELGWLYGADAENPWNYTGDQLRPSLYFEGGLLVIDPAEATVALDSEFTVTVSCKGGAITEEDLGGFIFDMSDETILETLDMGFDGENVVLSFMAVKEGTVKLTVGLKGKTVESNITVKDMSGINDIVADESRISFDGTTVTAPGCTIDVYTAMGVRMLTASDSADLGRLGSGIYVVSARPTDGSAASTLKVRVK